MRLPSPRRGTAPLPASAGPAAPMPLDHLNTASRQRVEAALLDCCGSRRWAARLTEHRPYPDVEALLAAAGEASYDLTDDDLSEALAGESTAHHLPDFPDPTVGAGAPGALAAHTALRAARAAYESRFGHAFVICLDTVPDDEALHHVLDGIRNRLGNRPEVEREHVADELRRIARGRLARLVASPTDSRPRCGPPVPD